MSLDRKTARKDQNALQSTPKFTKTVKTENCIVLKNRITANPYAPSFNIRLKLKQLSKFIRALLVHYLKLKST